MCPLRITRFVRDIYVSGFVENEFDCNFIELHVIDLLLVKYGVNSLNEQILVHCSSFDVVSLLLLMTLFTL